MEYSGTWKEIWAQKGEMEGGIDKLYIYNGWEKIQSGYSNYRRKNKERIEYPAGG